jgi:transposase-like protein
MDEHGVAVDHATLNRWVLKYVPPLDHADSDEAGHAFQ